MRRLLAGIDIARLWVWTPELLNQHLSKADIHPFDFVAYELLRLAPDFRFRLCYGTDFPGSLAASSSRF